MHSSNTLKSARGHVVAYLLFCFFYKSPFIRVNLHPTITLTLACSPKSCSQALRARTGDGHFRQEAENPCQAGVALILISVSVLAISPILHICIYIYTLQLKDFCAHPRDLCQLTKFVSNHQPRLYSYYWPTALLLTRSTDEVKCTDGVVTRLVLQGRVLNLTLMLAPPSPPTSLARGSTRAHRHDPQVLGHRVSSPPVAQSGSCTCICYAQWCMPEALLTG